MAFTYIASPYSHPDAEVRAERYRQVLTFTAEMLRKGLWCYSPIVHCHELAIVHNLPTDAMFWRSYNLAMLSVAKAMIVLQIEGWSSSKGVAGEIAMAKDLNISVSYLSP